MLPILSCYFHNLVLLGFRKIRTLSCDSNCTFQKILIRLTEKIGVEVATLILVNKRIHMLDKSIFKKFISWSLLEKIIRFDFYEIDFCVLKFLTLKFFCNRNQTPHAARLKFHLNYMNTYVHHEGFYSPCLSPL